MIALIVGKIEELTPTSVIVLCAGVGYGVNITPTDYAKLRDAGDEARLWITEIIREDTHELYGFLRKEDRLFFDKLRTVSGVGPSTARLILAKYSAEELAAAISSGSVEQLQRVKGIGLKTAQRIIVDLKGKIDLSEVTPEVLERIESATQDKAAHDEALRALKMLGFAEPAIKKALQAVEQNAGSLPVEELIKQSLKRL